MSVSGTRGGPYGRDKGDYKRLRKVTSVGGLSRGVRPLPYLPNVGASNGRIGGLWMKAIATRLRTDHQFRCGGCFRSRNIWAHHGCSGAGFSLTGVIGRPTASASRGGSYRDYGLCLPPILCGDGSASGLTVAPAQDGFGHSILHEIRPDQEWVLCNSPDTGIAIVWMEVGFRSSHACCGQE